MQNDHPPSEAEKKKILKDCPALAEYLTLKAKLEQKYGGLFKLKSDSAAK